MTDLFALATVLMFCSCVFMAPHLDRRLGLQGAIAFAAIAALALAGGLLLG